MSPHARQRHSLRRPGRDPALARKIAADRADDANAYREAQQAYMKKYGKEILHPRRTMEARELKAAADAGDELAQYTYTTTRASINTGKKRRYDAVRDTAADGDVAQLTPEVARRAAEHQERKAKCDQRTLPRATLTLFRSSTTRPSSRPPTTRPATVARPSRRSTRSAAPRRHSHQGSGRGG